MIQGDFASLLTALIAGYLLGAVPFGLVLTRLAGYGDLRHIGSGNIGATNVLRTGNKPLAALTLVLDIGKGAAAALILMGLLGREHGIMAGIGAISGHLFPVWLAFKGGKGVATTLGTIIALSPPTGGAVCLLWLLVAAISRYSSLAALISLGAAPLLAYGITHDAMFAGMCAIIFIMIVIKHRSNIKRLMAGEEPKIGNGGNKA